MNAVRTTEWTDAQRRCRLSDAALAMAKELGLAPHSLVKNIPNRSEPWKAPVEEWVRRLHEEKFRHRRTSSTAAPSPPPAPPTPAPRPDIAVPPLDPAPHLVSDIDAAREALFARLADGELDEDSFLAAVDRVEYDPPVSTGEIDDDDARMLRRRDCFRRFADLFATAAAKLDFVQSITLFGSVAAPLEKEILATPACGAPAWKSGTNAKTSTSLFGSAISPACGNSNASSPIPRTSGRPSPTPNTSPASRTIKSTFLLWSLAATVTAATSATMASVRKENPSAPSPAAVPNRCFASTPTSRSTRALPSARTRSSCSLGIPRFR